jgi:hypothetical protein
MVIKRFIFFVVLSGIVIFGINCRSAQPKAAEAVKTKPSIPESPKIEAVKSAVAEPEIQKPEQPKAEVQKTEPAKAVAAKPEAPKAEQPKAEAPKAEEAKVVTAVPEAPKTEQPKPEPQKTEEAKAVPAVAEAEKPKQPKREPQKSEPSKTAAKDSFYKECRVILNPTFVTDNGMVDYKLLKRKKQELQRVLEAFARFDPNEYKSWAKEDKIAFWLNVYNIELLKIISDNYPIKTTRIHLVFWPPTSIRHIRGIWTDYKFIVMGEQFTLSEIEQRFFRKEFGEPKVYMGVSQASLSGPPLHNEPYAGSKLYEQLDDQAKKFLSSAAALNIDDENHIVYLSAIFQSTWYGNEFRGKYGTEKKFKDQPPEARAVLNFIISYVSKETASYLEVKNYTVNYIIYDWRLNE